MDRHNSLPSPSERMLNLSVNKSPNSVGDPLTCLAPKLFAHEVGNHATQHFPINRDLHLKWRSFADRINGCKLGFFAIACISVTDGSRVICIWIDPHLRSQQKRLSFGS